ncbi:hypothetical protein M409DRAFT_17804 [Zasmidium cellare ATCC 36951]|uniref:N-acetyltransferase domain-containing protein n=1 Tax=Zasmidium cellare ATCC 36951 TaxID=1080233 RepID=A0A6A6D307_ZASCE|nr:uncharacterized protein M409DRAFT_17804 [Zasmidium cellare ATCC 36951]KAF2172572.1 hypothetical protein M409DRAFT_17804 [Zasmidium cellare ATCC 36951]
MSTVQTTPTPRTWRHQDDTGDYVISTSTQLLDREFITASFATEDMYWAKPLGSEQLELTLSQSLTFGLYKSTPLSSSKRDDSPSSPRTPSPTLEAEKDEDLEQIGLARFVTDHVTFVYISDVYIVRDHRGKGLGRFLMSCFRDVLKGMPMLRRVILLSGSKVTQGFYARELGMWDTREEENLASMTRTVYED